MRIDNIGRGEKGKRVEIGDIVLFFSYKTLVGFKTPRDGVVCCENIWGSVTGGHLNCIEPDHSLRLDPPTFMIKVDKLMGRFKY